MVSWFGHTWQIHHHLNCGKPWLGMHPSLLLVEQFRKIVCHAKIAGKILTRVEMVLRTSFPSPFLKGLGEPLDPERPFCLSKCLSLHPSSHPQHCILKRGRHKSTPNSGRKLKHWVAWRGHQNKVFLQKCSSKPLSIKDRPTRACPTRI